MKDIFIAVLVSVLAGIIIHWIFKSLSAKNTVVTNSTTNQASAGTKVVVPKTQVQASISPYQWFFDPEYELDGVYSDYTSGTQVGDNFQGGAGGSW